MKDVLEYDEELYHNIIKNPEKYIYNTESCIKEYYDYVDDIDRASIRFHNMEESRLVRELRVDDMDDMVAIDGIISKSTSVKPKTSVAKFKCMDCENSIQDVKQIREVPRYPERCRNGDCSNQNKNKFKFMQKPSKKVNYQKLRIQEPPEDVEGGESPEEIDVLVHGDIAGDIKPGKRVKVTGILKSKKFTTGPTQNGTLESTSLGQFIMCIDIEPQRKDFENLEITDEDEEEIKEIAKRADLYDYLSRSVAPSIEGTLDDEKKAMMLQLFSGVNKSVSGDNTSIRGDIHILLVGDPGTGKSQAINYVKQLAPRGVQTNGKGATSAGLTATAVQGSEFGGDNKWTVEAGALPLSDKGIAIVDEIDKMDSSDRSAMHEALEQQRVSISKAGLNTTLKSRCSLLAAANPDSGRVKSELTIPEQINLEPPLISRFDLIFVVRDDPDEDIDSNISQTILDYNLEGEKLARGEEVEESVNENVLDAEMFRKYVAYARRNVKPKMTQDVKDKLEEYYVNIRQKGDGIPVTARKLEGLVRISEAAARARLSDTVTEKDAEIAIEIVEASLNDVGKNPNTGEFDAGMINSGTTKEERDKVTSLISLVKKMDTNRRQNNDEYKGIPIEEVVNEAMDRLDYDNEDEVEKELHKLDENGKIRRPEADMVMETQW
jgi:replicative DNA helicase Mcm